MTSTSSIPARRTTRWARRRDGTQKPLYGYKPDDPDDARSTDLAEGKPEISEDGKTVTVKIKPGVKFSPPVDREVTSKDVKYAIERGFFNTVNNGYAGAYFGDIVGAKVGVKPGTTIAGIETPDDTTIVFKLKRAHRPASSAGRSSMPLTAPVPEEYARKFDKENPSTYGENQVATGPYMIENDAAGKAIGYEAGQADRPGPQPELGQGARTSSRPTSMRSTCPRATTTRRSPRARSSTGRA